MPSTPFEKIPEIDILISTCLWLHSEGWRIESISIARGQGINTHQDKQKLRTRMAEAQVPFDHVPFSSNGADITAQKDSVTFKIECKGLGSGKLPTLRNNFDRALASAVSYVDRPNGLLIGLAMPRDDAYISLIRSKIPRALREALHFWILLYNPDKKSIDSYSPNDGV